MAHLTPAPSSLHFTCRLQPNYDMYILYLIVPKMFFGILTLSLSIRGRWRGEVMSSPQGLDRLFNSSFQSEGLDRWRGKGWGWGVGGGRVMFRGWKKRGRRLEVVLCPYCLDVMLWGLITVLVLSRFVEGGNTSQTLQSHVLLFKDSKLSSTKTLGWGSLSRTRGHPFTLD